MNMQQLMQQAQAMQRKMAKMKQELEAKEFTATANGGVTVKMNGKKEILNLEIDEDLLNPASKDMLTEMMKNALNKVLTEIEEENAKIEEAAAGGMHF